MSFIFCSLSCFIFSHKNFHTKYGTIREFLEFSEVSAQADAALTQVNSVQEMSLAAIANANQIQSDLAGANTSATTAYETALSSLATSQNIVLVRCASKHIKQKLLVVLC